MLLQNVLLQNDSRTSDQPFCHVFAEILTEFGPVVRIKNFRCLLFQVLTVLARFMGKSKKRFLTDSAKTSRHPGMATYPAINRKRLPAVLPEGLIPAPNRIVVQVQKLGDHLTGFAIIQKKDRIRTSPATTM